ncbi:putative NAD(P)-binding domain-containing protein [Lupinus albus]|uniref:Putative NAD(P)-binding domain-containing protein n=1 Tax=Lupinus albus TaxID=3870 RepID=A0A6A4NKT3_LUPAL|nr:putative NAD(P)-binding domain-containing protein [Lupinus albus]
MQLSYEPEKHRILLLLLLLLMGLGTIVHFNSTTLFCFHQNQTLFQPFGFPCSNSNNLLFSTTPSWRIRLKSSPLSLYLSFMATHLHVSQGSPSQHFEVTPSLHIGHNDLLIVGPGVLGRLVAQKWSQEYPGCQVFGQTVTTDHHEELNKIGISPSLKWTEAGQKFPYVIFCAPPYQSSDYHRDLRLAALSWNGEGSFLFTSSSAPYDCNDNGSCDEDTPVVPIGRSHRTDVLLKAENIVLEFGGSVVRLSGLYISFLEFNLLGFQISTLSTLLFLSYKGAHAYWLEKGSVECRPDHILNLIHYEDAASLSVAILKKKFRRQIFLGCDNHPLSRQEITDLVNQSGKFSKKFDKFTGTDDPLGKRLNNSRTRQEVGWEPKYSSFPHFLDTL